MIKFFKFIIGIMLIPACIGFSRGYIEWLTLLKSLSYNQKTFLYGILAYLVIHLIFRKPITVYVFGHEITHALWSKIFGGEVKDLKVSSKGGEVKTTESNFIITLAPYFFPIYTFIILIVFWIIALFMDNYQNYISYYLFLVGFSLSFHILLTFEMIRLDQPDIKEHGFIFSSSIIYFINLLIISALTKIIFFNNYEYTPFIYKSISISQKIYIYIYINLINGGMKLIQYCKDLYSLYSTAKSN